MPHLLRVTVYALVLALTVVDVIRSSPHRRYCGKQLTKALIALCGSVKSPNPEQLETGRRPEGDQSIVHECCRKSCNEKFMRRYCAE
ncbi:hypothetical protein GCK32_004143 [Trichostrongylus colubriformis]|uniref:Insulin-like domain-containing protein n=1 Tax=Trichostrongylus colubriformis TaxID=6319 RepID=A0AAN8F3B3_TRICO